MSERALAAALASRTGTRAEDWFAVLKARSGMEVVLRVLREVRGPGAVLTQVFTCATAVDPVLVAGFEPRYGEVSPATLALDPARLEVDGDVRAVVAQHTFGIVDEAATARLREAAHGAGAILLEDAAHAATRMARQAGRPLADVSVHSFGAEKLFATKFGGAVWLSPDLDPVLRERLVAALRDLPTPGVRLRLAMRTYLPQLRVLGRLGGLGERLRGALLRLGLHEPPVAPVEQAGRLAHPAMRSSRWVLRQLLAALAWSGTVQARRAEAVAVYARELAQVPGLELPAVGRQPLVRFPCYAADGETAERIVTTLRAKGVLAGRWYRPALFPGPTDPAIYRYRPGTLPVTEDLVERVVNLPTAVTAAQAREVAARVRALLGA